MQTVSTSARGSIDERSAQLVTEIVVPSLEDTVSFLLALGFALERRTVSFAALKWADAYLLVAEDADAAIPNRWMSIRVVVPDVHAMHQRVITNGIGVADAVKDGGYGLLDFVVSGPGAVDVRFAQVR